MKCLMIKNRKAFLLILILDFRRALWYPYNLKGVRSMPKNRVLPFGYCMRNGEIDTEPKEVYAVSTIFSEYLKGSS